MYVIILLPKVSPPIAVATESMEETNFKSNFESNFASNFEAEVLLRAYIISTIDR